MTDSIDLDWSGSDLIEGDREGTLNKIRIRDQNGQPFRSSNDGSTYVRFEWRMTDNDEILSDVLMTSGQYKYMGFKKLRALGLPDGSPLVPENLEGMRATLTCKKSKNKKTGEDQLSISKYVPLVGHTPPIKQDDPWGEPDSLPPKRKDDSGVPF